MLRRVKSILFGFLTISNLGLAVFFYNFEMFDHCALSGATTFLCALVWAIDMKVSSK
jgi:hypothetical protein